MGIYGIEAPTPGGVGHATYSFYSNNCTYYYDSLVDGGKIRPCDAPNNTKPESVIYIRRPEKLTTLPPSRDDSFHLGPRNQ